MSGTVWLDAESRKAVASKYRNSLQTIGRGLNLSSTTTGALAELMVCENLIRKGYEVFRAISAASKCDIVAIRNTKCIRIEVKAGTFNPRTNKFHYPIPAAERYDVLAIVTVDGIRYIPALEEMEA